MWSCDAFNPYSQFPFSSAFVLHQINFRGFLPANVGKELKLYESEVLLMNLEKVHTTSLRSYCLIPHYNCSTHTASVINFSKQG